MTPVFPDVTFRGIDFMATLQCACVVFHVLIVFDIRCHNPCETQDIKIDRVKFFASGVWHVSRSSYVVDLVELPS